MFDNYIDFSSMHDSIKKRNKVNALIIMAAVILLAVARVILTRFHVDPDMHFYTSVYIRFFDYAIAAGITALYIGSAFVYKYKRDEHNYSAASDSFVQGTLTLVFSASVAAFFLAFSAGLQIWNLFADSAEGAPATEVLIGYARNNPLEIFIFIAAILSSIYFFRTAALNHDAGADVTSGDEFLSKEYSQRYIIMSLMPIAWSLLNTFRCFFDMSRAVNSPVRIYELMCFLALSAYFVSESRMLIGRLRIARFFTFAYIAVIFIALSALPNLILSSFWGVMQTNEAHIVYAVQLAFALYIAARIYSQIKYGRFSLER